MSPPITDPSRDLALALAGLRGDLGTAMARIEGALALLVHRSDQTDQALGLQRDQVLLLEKRCDAIELAIVNVPKYGTRLDALDRWMWLCLGGAIVFGATAGIVATILMH